MRGSMYRLLLGLVAMMSDMNLGKTYKEINKASGKLPEKKTSNHFYSGKTLYQAPLVNKYYNSYRPRSQLTSSGKRHRGLERKV